jgi:hypothetical protein
MTTYLVSFYNQDTNMFIGTIEIQSVLSNGIDYKIEKEISNNENLALKLRGINYYYEYIDKSSPQLN